MRTITQRELRNGSASVMDAVESGETIVITRNGTPVAELRPLRARPPLGPDELVARHRRLPRVSFEELRAEADELFGTDDRLGDPADR